MGTSKCAVADCIVDRLRAKWHTECMCIEGGKIMAIVPAKCTNCGSSLQVDNAKEAAICQHCGSAFIVEKAINHYCISNNITANTVNVYTSTKDFVIRAGVLEKYNGEDTTVVIPNGVRVIKTFAFQDCYALTNVVIPEGVIEIMDSAFEGCRALKSVKLPSTLRKMDGPFPDCPSLREIDIPAGIDEFSLRGTASLEKVVLHEGLQNISDAAFTYCYKLKEISVPQSVRAIGQVAFRHCASLRSVTIPKKVQTIEANAFQNCAALEEIIFLGEIPEFKMRGERVCENWQGCMRLLRITSPEQSFQSRHERIFEGTPWYYRRKNLCVYCGSHFKGLIKKQCSRCGRPKDY